MKNEQHYLEPLNDIEKTIYAYYKELADKLNADYDGIEAKAEINGTYMYCSIYEAETLDYICDVETPIGTLKMTFNAPALGYDYYVNLEEPNKNFKTHLERAVRLFIDEEIILPE